MIDIHCHILPDIDDGAPEREVSLAMLSQQWDSGVEGVFLTPHFYPEELEQDRFLEKREASWKELTAGMEESVVNRLRLGAEVRYCPQLLELELESLTLDDSGYLLLELPGRQYPAYLPQIVEKLLSRGVLPVFAHVERCGYFRQEPELLRRLVEQGALAQVSADALFDRRDRNFSVACLQHGLAQVVASDAHDTALRRPNLSLCGKLPQELWQLHTLVTEAIWNNEMPLYFRPTPVKKTFFGYR